MYHITGLTAPAIAALYRILSETYPRPEKTTGRPVALTQQQQIRAAIIYSRRNRTEADLAETFDVSQATISRAITTWTPRLAAALQHLVPTVDDLDPRQTLIIDGTLVPCWDWSQQTGLYSGKHHRTGLNLSIWSREGH